MLYCTRCGSDLKGSKVRCPVCGYEVIKMKMDLSKPREIGESRSNEGEPKPWAPQIPDQRKEPEGKSAAPIEAVEMDEVEESEENDPRYVDGCSICGGHPVHRCFFTLAPLCKRHTVYMQIFVRNMAFGEKVPAAPDVASRKEGMTPTPSEAKEAGMFFTVKPYHEWKRVSK